jgi:UPF0755 protein
VRRLVALVLILSALWLGWLLLARRPLRRADEPPVTLVIPQGASVSEIGQRVHDLGLVRHPVLFRLVVMLRGDAARLHAGEYAIEGPLTLGQLIDKIARGEVVRHEVTFPEGKALAEMAKIVAARGLPEGAFLAAARDPGPIHDLDAEARDLEGYLFPDTYDVPRGPDPARMLVERMVKRFRDVTAAERALLKDTGLTLRETVTLASLVELETARPEERPRIAAVFHNRLKIGMPLQTDPTVIYAMRQAGSYDGNIRRADLDIDSPYNTYRNRGLPPGPIASPGLESLRAVLRAPATKELYFVSRNDGRHFFSATLAEHQRAVDFYQRGRGSAPVEGPLAAGLAPSPPPAR